MIRSGGSSWTSSPTGPRSSDRDFGGASSNVWIEDRLSLLSLLLPSDIPTTFYLYNVLRLIFLACPLALAALLTLFLSGLASKNVQQLRTLQGLFTATPLSLDPFSLVDSAPSSSFADFRSYYFYLSFHLAL